MQDVMTTIELGGALGKIFGRRHQRAVGCASEAIRALCHTLDGFEQYLNASKSRGLTYAVFKGKENLGSDDLAFPVRGEAVRIMPVIIGSKRAGMLQTILGAVLVAVALFAPGGVVEMGFAGSGMWGQAALFGASMMLGGVVQMLAPQTPGLASRQDSDNKASYAFGGVTNTAAQGYPVALAYGTSRIGGAIISAGIYVEDKQ